MPDLVPEIAILDDHIVVAESIANALETRMGIRTLAIARSVDELRAMLETASPNAIVADVQLEHGLGLDVLDLPEVRDGAIPVLFLSSYDKLSTMTVGQRALTAGYLLKTTSIDNLANAIRVVCSGNRVFDSRLQSSQERGIPSPTEREMELLRALASGRTNVEVGHELGISSRTVESHLRRLFARYGVSSRSQLLMLAIRRGWIGAGQNELEHLD